MFEGLVSELLTKFLGKYIKDLDGKQLNIGIWSGNVALNNLEIKGEALDELNLPVNVKRGVVGRIELQVPWKNLSSKPVVATVEDLYILCGPQANVVYDEKAARESALAKKKDDLAKYELMRAAKRAEKEGTASKEENAGFVAKLVEKVVDNIQITIKHIHIRYEAHSLTDPQRVYAFGITLDSLAVVSTDENWVPKFLEGLTTKLRNKLVDLNTLVIYMDIDAHSLESLNTVDLCKELRKLISSAPPPKKDDAKKPAEAPKSYLPLQGMYILKPLSAQMRTTINMANTIDVAVPKIQAELVIPDISIALSEDQYHTTMEILDSMGTYSQALKYIKYRPRQPVAKCPRKWFRYAACVIRDDVHEKGIKTDFNHILLRRSQREKYVELYKRNQGLDWLQPLKPEEKKELEKLEEDVPFDDLVFFRSVANQMLEKEMENKAKRDEYRKKKEAEAKAQRGWFSGWFGSSKPAETEPDADEPSLKLSAEQMDGIYDIVGYDAKEIEIKPPPEYMVVKASLSLGAINLALTGVSDGRMYVKASENKPLLSASLEKIDASFIKRPENVALKLSVAEFHVDDCVTPDTCFPQMVSLAHIRDKDGKDTAANSFLNVAFELAPLDHHADTVLDLLVNSIDVVVTKPFIDRIGSFFKARTQVNLTSIQDSTASSIWSAVAASQSQLEQAVRDHKTVDLSLVVHGPCVFVPQYANDPKSTIVILDLGMLEMKSELKKDLASSSQIVAEKDANLYDDYKLDIRDIQVLMAQLTKETLHVRPWRQPELSAKLPFCQRVIEEFTFGLNLMLCIKPNELTLTTTVVEAQMPTLSLRIPLTLYDKVMSFMETFVPPAEHDVEMATAESQQEAASVDYDRIIGTTSSSNSTPLELSDVTEEEREAAEKERQSEEEKAHLQKLLAEHKKVEAHVLIKQIVLTLSDADEQGNDRDLMRISIADIAANAAMKTWDMAATVSLGSLSIEDSFAKRAGLVVPYLATSYAVSKEGVDQADLLSVSFAKFERGTPIFGKVDMMLDVHFNQFYIVCNQTTLAQLITVLLAFSDKISGGSKKNPAPAPAPAAQPSPKTETPATKTETPAATAASSESDTETLGLFKVPDIVKTKVKARLDMIGIILMEENTHLAEFHIQGFSGDVALKERTMQVEAALHDVRLVDCCASSDVDEATGVTTYKKRDVMCSANNQVDMITAKYTTFCDREEQYPGFDADVSAHLLSLRIFPVFSFLYRVKDYFLDGPLLKALNRDALKEAVADTYNDVSSNIGNAMTDMVSQQLKGSEEEESKEGEVADTTAAEKPKEDDTAAAAAAAATTTTTTTTTPASNQPPEQKKQRMRLDVVMEAPQITIPLDYVNPDAVIVNLGVLKVSNEFIDKPGEAPINKMKVELSSMAIDTKIGEDVMPILQEVSLAVLFSQPLIENCRTVPEQLIKIDFHPFRLRLTEHQLIFLLQFVQDLQKKMLQDEKPEDPSVLSSSVSRSAPEDVSPSSTEPSALSASSSAAESDSPDPTITTTTTTTTTTAANPSAEADKPAEEPKDKADDNKADDNKAVVPAKQVKRQVRSQDEMKSFLTKVFTAIPKTEMHFKMEEISFEILTGKGVEKDDSLAMFGFFGIGADICIYHDTFMKVAASLGAIVLTDKRKNTPAAFVNVINTGDVHDGEEPRDFIDFVMVQHSASGDKAVSAVISRPEVHVLPSIICAVMDFFMNPLAKMQEALAEQSGMVNAPLRRTQNVALLLHSHLRGTEKKSSSKRRLRITGTALMEWTHEIPGIKDDKDALELCNDLLAKKFITLDRGQSSDGDDDTFKASETAIYVVHRVKKADRMKYEEDKNAESKDAKQEEAAATEGTVTTTAKKGDEEEYSPAMFAEFSIISPEIRVYEDERSADTNCAFVTVNLSGFYMHGSDNSDVADVKVRDFQFTIQQLKDGVKDPAARCFYILAPVTIGLAYAAANSKKLLESKPEDSAPTVSAGAATAAAATAAASTAKNNDDDDSDDEEDMIREAAANMDAYEHFQSQNIIANISSIRLSFSFQTLQLALKIFDTLKPIYEPKKKEAKEDKKEDDDEEIAPVVASKKDKDTSAKDAIEIEKRALAVMKEEEAEIIKEVSKDQYEYKQGLTMSCQGIWLTLINDFHGRYLPLLEVSISELDVNAQDWSSALCAGVNAVLFADYLNEDIMMPEPLIEHWAFAAQMNSRSPTETDPKVAQQTILLRADKRLDINISPVVLNSISRTMASLNESLNHQSQTHESVVKKHQGSTVRSIWKKMDDKDDASKDTATAATAAAATAAKDKNDGVPDLSQYDADDKDIFHGSWIVNKTGIDAVGICRFRDDGMGMEDAVKFFDVKANDCVPVTLGDGSSSSRSGINIPVRVCKMILGNEGIENVTVDIIGRHLHPLVNGNAIVSEVTWNNDGTKLTTLRSSVTLRNDTDKQLRVFFTPPGGKVTDPSSGSMTIAPNSSEPIPIPYTSGYVMTLQVLDDNGQPLTGLSNESISSKSFYIEGNSAITLKSAAKDAPKNQSIMYLLMGVALDRSTFANDQFALSTISFSAPFSITNALACSADFCVSYLSPSQKMKKQKIESEDLVKPDPDDYCINLPRGDTHTNYFINPEKELHVTLSGIKNFKPGSILFKPKATETHVEKVVVRDGNGFNLDLCVEVSVKPTRSYVFYAPFWLINKTYVPLLYLVGTRPIAGQGVDPDYIPHQSSRGVVGDLDEKACNPFMCSWNKLAICTKTSMASKPFQFDAVGSTGVVEFIDTRAERLYSFNVSCYMGTGIFTRTKMITFCPQHVFVNQLTDYTVSIHQVIDKKPTVLKPGGQLSFHWWTPDSDCTEISKIPRRATLTINDKSDTHESSGYFMIDEVGSSVLRLRSKSPKEKDLFLQYEIVNSSYTSFILLRSVSTENAPYLIVNDTPYELSVKQKDESAPPTVVKKFTERPYSWDNPVGTQELMVKSRLFGDNEEKEHKYAINKLRDFDAIVRQGHCPIHVYVIARGATRVLVFTADEDRYADECKDKNEKNTKGKDGKEVAVVSEKPSLSQMGVDLAGIGINIITSEPKDFLFLTIEKIMATLVDTGTERQIELKINKLQLDNETEDTDYPVILAGKGKENNPWFHLSIVMSTQYESIMFFEYFSFLMYDIVLNFETKLIGQILDFVGTLPSFGSGDSGKEEEKKTEDESEKKDDGNSSISAISTTTTTTTTSTSSSASSVSASSIDPSATTTTTTTTKSASSKAIEKPKRVLKSMWEYPGENIINSQTNKEQIVYFRLFHLNSIKIILSLNSSAGVSLLNLPASPVTVLLDTVLGTAANMDEAALCFNALYMENPFVPMAELQSRITQHYIRQGFQAVFKLLGCTEVLGNPVGLFSNISTGVMDFFYEPAKGMVQSPQAFAKGLAKGTSSLVKNTMYATFDSMSKIVGALGKGVATLSCDDEYVKRRQANMRKKPKHALDGVGQGAIALGRGVFDGITGIVMKPIEGVRREGAVGLFKGIGQGVIGVAVKPVAGILEATSKTAEGIRNTATMFDDDRTLYRVRSAPRQFTENKQLLEFDEYESDGVMFLSQNQAFRGDKHILHAMLKQKKKEVRFAVLSNRHLAVMIATSEKYVYKTQKIILLTNVTNRVLDGPCLSISIRDVSKPLKLTLNRDEDAVRLNMKMEFYMKKANQ